MQATLEEQLGALLNEKGLTLAAAESCTGGRVSDRVTNVAGASRYFLGAIVAYCNAAKIALLAVRPQTLEQNGAVSEATAKEMASGARIALGADIAVSITGIAGPGGGDSEKPVGLTWIGVSSAIGEQAHRFIWNGNRLDNKASSTDAALTLLLETALALPAR